MSFKNNIKKILLVALWIAVAASVLVLLGAAIRKKNSQTCKGYRIVINEGKAPLFIDQKLVLNLLTTAGNTKIAGKTISSFNLQKMEASIAVNLWIREARLFIDNNGVLQIRVSEKIPIARVFTIAGNSFYVDSSSTQLPLSEKGPIRLPVFTGFPSERILTHGTDSALITQIKNVSCFISKDDFWRAEIDQINITKDKTFEMVPAIGNHIIEFGDGTDIDKKFHRLFIFYQDVLSKTGFDKYSKINVQYAEQVIGTKRGGGMPKVDSIQASKNIARLIMLAQELQVDTLHQRNTKPLEHNTITEQTLTNYDIVPDSDN